MARYIIRTVIEETETEEYRLKVDERYAHFNEMIESVEKTRDKFYIDAAILFSEFSKNCNEEHVRKMLQIRTTQIRIEELMQQIKFILDVDSTYSIQMMECIFSGLLKNHVENCADDLEMHNKPFNLMMISTSPNGETFH